MTNLKGVGENQSEFPRIGLGVELRQVSHPHQKERRPKWPFGFEVGKWEFRENFQQLVGVIFF